MKIGSRFLGRLLGVSHGCLERRPVLEEGQSEVHFQCGKRPERGSQGKRAVPIEQVNLNGLIPPAEGPLKAVHTWVSVAHHWPHSNSHNP